MNAQPHRTVDPHTCNEAAPPGQEPPTEHSRSNGFTAVPDPRALISAVRLWEELQRYRIRVSNHLSATERGGAAIPIELAKHLVRMTDSEKEIGKLIVREWRTHPLAPWAKGVHGLGEHSIAVLVAMLDGDPYVAYPKHWESSDQTEARGQSTPDDEPEQARVESRSIDVSPARVLVADTPHTRTVSQLWQYAGIGQPGRRRQGMTQEEALSLGKPLLKSRLRLIAESFIKAGNETYRAVYDNAKTNVSERNHESACPQCKAKAGDPWKPGHQHAHALRIVAKRFLADLYDEAKRLHETGLWR